MTITIEAIYEAGVLKPLAPLLNLEEHEKVRVTVEKESVAKQPDPEPLWLSAEAFQAFLEAEGPEKALDLLLQDRLDIDPELARQIMEDPDLSVLEG